LSIGNSNGRFGGSGFVERVGDLVERSLNRCL